MDFETVISNSFAVKYLKETIENDRIAHAQLFSGEEGVGTLAIAIAYATEQTYTLPIPLPLPSG